MERSFVMFKPDCLERRLLGRILSRFEEKGLRLIAPVVATVMEGPEAVRVIRDILGATSGLKAAAGTIRGDYSSSRQMNLVHASDSPESAAREIAIYFKADEVLAWDPTLSCWLQAPDEKG
jgi:nucleoside-diphosphate kinase